MRSDRDIERDFEEGMRRYVHWHTILVDEEKFEAGKETEFGKGLMVCLGKWFQHFADDRFKGLMCLNEYTIANESQKERYYNTVPADVQGEILLFNNTVEIYGSKEAAFSNVIMLWAYGASDHLHDIKVPEGGKWDEVRSLVEELQSKGLEMGHGVGFLTQRLYSWGDVEELQYLTQKIMIKVDRVLGLQPDWGQW